MPFPLLPMYDVRLVSSQSILSMKWLYCHTTGHTYSESKNIWKHSNLQQIFNRCAKLNLKFTFKKLNSDMKQVWQVVWSVHCDKLRLESDT